MSRLGMPPNIVEYTSQLSALVGGIHVAGNIEVVVVLPNLINAHQTAELIDITIPCHRIHDAFDIARTQLVVLAVLSEIFGGIHNKHMVIVAVLAQHHHDSRNARAKENVRWQVR